MNQPRLSDGDDRFYKLVTRLRPSQLGNGEVSISENGRMDVDGIWKTREGYENVSGVVLSDEDAAILQEEDAKGALVLIAVSAGSDTAAIVAGVCTVTTASPHGLPSAHTSVIGLSGFTAAGSGADINGNREVSHTGASTFTFPIASADDTYTSGTVGPFILSGVSIEIRGSCLFSDPSDENAEYIIVATNSKAVAIKVGEFTKTDIDYPGGAAITSQAHLIQEFSKVVLRREGQTAWEWDGDLSGSPAFTAVASGAKTQHRIYDTANNTVFASGVATVDTTVAHGLTQDSAYDEKSDPPRTILVASAASYTFLEGLEIEIATVPDANTFTFYVNAQDDAGTSIVYSTRASLGGGYINMPAAPWGAYHQRRSWLPYTHTDESNPMDREIRDEIIASDILDNSTYDPIAGQFRISGGTSDFVTAIHGFDDDRLLVFCRNSIHYLRGVSGSLGDVETIQLTGEIGCLARRSVVSVGNQVLFLSDNGVYSIGFVDEYNLRGTELPLSEAVDSISARITRSAADLAVAVYHDNRYWIALPIDGSEFNNAILVYNFLNKGWESLDTTTAAGTGWCIEDLIQSRAGKVNDLYAVTTYGGIHKIDQTMREKDYIATTISGEITALDIPARFRTRQYTWGTMERKKVNRLRALVESDDDFVSEASASIIIEDPDKVVNVGNLSDAFTSGSGLPAGESGTLHQRVGNPRGYGAQFELNVEDGRPSVRGVQMDAIPAFESTTSVT